MWFSDQPVHFMRISTQNAQWLSQLGLLQHYVPPTDPMRPFDCPDELTSQISSGELFRTILLKEAERLQNQELFNKVHRISVPSTNPQATPQSTYEELFVVFSYIDEETVDRVLSYLEQVCKRLEPEPGL
ncbi:hypothetical protein BLNAU_12230 [Blattamonas nauphoetae]|uniref:Uncharacterized protein n=1 Tax=Blattamonas nauphoetae TaxID=2049346 RepID=A0ABQ9XK02_9EUKA|nr:hypothetical protein BLNAU_12230 [Blattamonas nauphoetae]